MEVSPDDTNLSLEPAASLDTRSGKNDNGRLKYLQQGSIENPRTLRTPTTPNSRKPGKYPPPFLLTEKGRERKAPCCIETRQVLARVNKNWRINMIVLFGGWISGRREASEKCTNRALYVHRYQTSVRHFCGSLLSLIWAWSRYIKCWACCFLV